MNIQSLDAGVIITRNEPSAPFEGGRSFLCGEKEEPHRDRSYIADQLVLVGVESGLIVLRRKKGEVLDDTPIVLPTDLWSEGWAPYPVDLVARVSA